MQINITYDASVSSAPAGFKAAVDAAVQYYETTFNAPITINIAIGWGEMGGDPIPDGALGVSTPAGGYAVNYTEIRNALWRDARTTDALTAALALPLSDPTSGGTFYVTSAQAKALGLLNSDDTSIDGYVGLDSSATYTFDPNNRAVDGAYDAIGVIEHEIAHVLGRVSFAGEQASDGATLFSPLDLFRYSAGGVLTPASTDSFFSLNGQTLLLPFNDPNNEGTSSDWSETITGDVFGAFADLGLQDQVSATDYSLLDVLGYHVIPAKLVQPTTTAPSKSAITVTSDTAVPLGETWYWTGQPMLSNATGFEQKSGNIVNAGTMIVSSGDSFRAVGISGVSYASQYVFMNTGSMYINAHDHQADAYGFWGMYNAASVDNSGLIQVVSDDGVATGVSVAGGDSPKFVNRATGVLKVQARGELEDRIVSAGTAVGVDYGAGGSFDNAGLIDVSGTVAIGVRGASTINNSGTIKATSIEDGKPSIAVAMYSFSYSRDTQPTLYTNTGTIIGDWAFYMNTASVADSVAVVNFGKIIGSSWLGDTDVTFQNGGIVGGDIYFGNSTNIYDGATGSLYGSLFLSIGNDTVHLGANDDIVYAVGGTGAITGGAGNDFIEISHGTYTVDGGTGFNTLSLAAATMGYIVDLGAGTAIGAGTSTLQYIQQVVGSDYDDRLVAGAAGTTLIAGSGHDTLIGGPGNDTLVAGDGGSDTLTGSGGNDTFIYSAGWQQTTITDFSPSRSVLKIYGYAAPASVQQLGADVLITLAAGDSVLLKNVSASALTSANVTYTSYSYNPPLLPGSVNPFGSGVLYLDQDVRTYAGEIIRETLDPVGIYTRGGSFDNYGDYSVSYNSADDHVYGLFDGNEDKHENSLAYWAVAPTRDFKNEAGAKFSVTNTQGGATGLFPKGCVQIGVASFRNDGQIIVSAKTDAFGIETDSGIAFMNNGTFTVMSSTANATGYDLGNGCNVTNSGTSTITAAKNATWLRMVGNQEQTISNTGTITVSADPGGHSYGMALGGSGSGAIAPWSKAWSINNAGSITAQDAIYIFDAAYSPTTYPIIHLNNCGTITGNITLKAGTGDQIQNTGTIAGAIRFGNGDSIYSGANGILRGAIYLGVGTNTVTLGSHDNAVVFAAPMGGTDTITGGASDDFIELVRGNNTITGGAGFNTLSFACATMGVAVDLGAGTAFAAGNDTISNIQKVIGGDFDDRLAAGATAAVLVAGSGHDTLIGGSSDDILVNGPGGGDVMTGGTGSDRFVYCTGGGQLVITDFAPGHDILAVYGYASASSIQQQGADTLVTLSSGDSVLLKSLQASQLSGGDIVYNVGAYPADPARPASPDRFGTSTIYYNADIKIYAGESITANGLGLKAMAGSWGGYMYSVDNAGSVTVTASTGNATGFTADYGPRAAQNMTFVNEAGGALAVTSSQGLAQGLFFENSQCPEVTNAGTIVVSGATSAYGVRSWGGKPVSNEATGTMSVSCSAGNAYGLYLTNGGDCTNNGALNVSSSANAYAVYLASYSTIVNTGTMTASTSSPGAHTYGIYGEWSDTFSIVNSGTITAETAVYADSESYYRHCEITNTGTINGDIVLGDSSQDVVANRGTINGNVSVLCGHATFDMRGGTLSGNISIGTSHEGAQYCSYKVYTGAGGLIKIGEGFYTDMAATIVGGAGGITTVQYNETAAQVTITHNSDSSWTVSTAHAGTAHLVGVQAVSFTDQTVALDPRRMVLSDFNADGRSDLILQNANGLPAVWLLDGTTQLAAVSLSTNPGKDWRVVGSGDFNGNGTSDILWQNTNGQLGIWFMNGTSVVSGVDTGANRGPSWHAIGSGDFDGDGKADVLWQNENGQAAIWLMNGNTVVSTADVGSNLGASWKVIGSGDFNGDGKADILWQNTSGQASIWLMDGTTVLSAPMVGSNPGSAWHVRSAGDFNGDGKADVLWQNDNGQAGIWLMDGTTVLSTPVVGPNPGTSWKVKGAADIDGDLKSDILWQSTSGQAGAWLMNGTNVISLLTVGTSQGKAWQVANNGSTPETPRRVRGDFNGDGSADVLWQNNSGQAGIWLLDGTTILSSPVVGNNPGASWHVKGSGDFDGDGKADILWQSDSGQAGIWLMNGTTVLSAPTVGPNPGPSWKVIGSGDFDGDGKADILWQSTSGQAGIWFMDGTTPLSLTTTGNNPGSTWHVIGSGDFNGDGKADILWQSDSGQAGIWLMNGTTVLSAPVVGSNPGPTWHVKGAGDSDGDGKSDILWQSDSGQAGIWFMDGTNVLSQTTTGSNPGAAWQVKGAADVNGDGKSDILWQNTNGQAGVWLMNGNTPLSQPLLGGNPGSAWHIVVSSGT